MRSNGRSNFAYQWNFVRNLKGRMRRKVAAFPERFSAEPLDRIRSVRDFDEAYTAPHFGFRDATDYYYRAASLRVVDRIQLPTLIITAADDPFVPPEPFSDPAVTGNPHITTTGEPARRALRVCGAADGVHDGYWAEWTAVSFAERIADCRCADVQSAEVLAVLRCRGHWALGRTPAPCTRHIGHLQSAICNRQLLIASRSINWRANSGPFPDSSCLKYTKVSFHCSWCARMMSAQRAMSASS